MDTIFSHEYYDIYFHPFTVVVVSIIISPYCQARNKIGISSTASLLPTPALF